MILFTYASYMHGVSGMREVFLVHIVTMQQTGVSMLMVVCKCCSSAIVSMTFIKTF